MSQSREPAKLSPGLRLWIEENRGTEIPRTAIVRPGYSTDLDLAVSELEAAGAVVESAGEGAIVVQADAATLQGVAALPWVRALEEPRLMELKLPELNPGS